MKKTAILLAAIMVIISIPYPAIAADNKRGFEADEIVPIVVDAAYGEKLNGLAFFRRGDKWGVLNKYAFASLSDERYNSFVFGTDADLEWCKLCGIVSRDHEKVYNGYGEIVWRNGGHTGEHTVFYETRKYHLTTFTNNTTDFMSDDIWMANVVTEPVLSDGKEYEVGTAGFMDSLEYTDLYALCRGDGSLISNQFFEDIHIRNDYSSLAREEYISDYTPAFRGHCFTDRYEIFAGKLNGKWKYYEANGRELALGIYDNAQSFSNGFAAVCLNGKWAYIAENSGAAVTNYVYDGASAMYADGTAFVKRGNEWFLEQIIDKGHVVPSGYKPPEFFTSPAQASSSQTGSTEKNGTDSINWKLKPKYKWDFVENLVPSYTNFITQSSKANFEDYVIFGISGEKGVASLDGLLASEPNSETWYCSNCILCFTKLDGTRQELNHELHKYWFNLFYDPDLKTFCINYYYDDISKLKITEGMRISEETKQATATLDAGNCPYNAAAYLLIVGTTDKNGGNYGYFVKPIQYRLSDSNFKDQGLSFSEYRTVYGGINAFIHGEDSRYSTPLFENDTFAAKVNDKWRIYDINGKPLFNETFEDARPLYNGYAAVKKDGKWGYIDKSGNTVVPFVLEDAASAFKNKTAYAKLNGLWGIINL